MPLEATEVETATDTNGTTPAPAAGGDSLLNGSPAPAAGEKAGAPASPEAAAAVEFKLPEGVKADAKLLGAFSELAKAHQIPADKAQALVTQVMEMFKSGDEARTQAMADSWAEQRKEWVEGLKTDKEFGGTKFPVTVEAANRALRKFGDDQLVADLQEYGIGDHAGLIRLLARVDAATREDSTIGSSRSSEGEVNVSALMYPSMRKSD
jgi:hypothetical protein